LSAEERERLQSLRFQADRERWGFSRQVLRALCGAYLGLAPGRVGFTRGACGKPALSPELRPAGGFHFNLSHSGDLCLFAFSSECELGVDVESCREGLPFEELARSVFGPEEAGNLAREGEGGWDFYRLWTRQEAALKAAGLGLAAWQELRASGQAGRLRQERIYELNVGAGYAAALCLAGEGPWPSILTFLFPA
jgi:4'-phosphopantetheinyl transferase